MTHLVAHILRTLRTAERITRPPRRPNHDVDEPLASDRYGMKRARLEPGARFYLKGGYRELCDDGMWEWHDAAGAEREAEEEVGEPRYCDVCGDEHDGPCTAMFEPSWLGRLTEDDTPNPTEPALTDDELVGVRGLLQERYEDHRPKWLTALIAATIDWAVDCDIDREGVEKFINRDKPPCDHRYCERQGYGLCFGVRAAMSDFTEDTRASAPDPGTGAEPNSPAASTAGDNPAGVEPPVPPAGIPLATWLEPAVMTVLAEHHPVYSDANQFVWCKDTNVNVAHRFWFNDEQAWREHVAPLITAHIVQALPDYAARNGVHQ